MSINQIIDFEIKVVDAQDYENNKISQLIVKENKYYEFTYSNIIKEGIS